MFPKPPRPEPPRRAQVMQIVQQKTTANPVPTVLIVPARPAAGPVEPPAPPGTEPAPPAD